MGGGTTAPKHADSQTKITPRYRTDGTCGHQSVPLAPEYAFGFLELGLSVKALDGNVKYNKSSSILCVLSQA